MDSSEVDIKKTDPVHDVVHPHLPAVSIVKLKQSRYEDVWPDDVHAAFMEAVSLYPPMGKRRLKYYRIATDENVPFPEPARVKSFGRCQLIQSYILDKTGKNRSRKQVSSHLQRLKKLHRDNPAMRDLFSEPSHLSSDYHGIAQTGAVVDSQHILNNFSSSAIPLKTEFNPTFNFRSATTGTDNSSAFPYLSEMSPSYSGTSSVLDSSIAFHNQPNFIFTQEKSLPKEGQAGTLLLSGSDHPFELHGESFFKDSMGGSFQAGPAFSTSTFSMTMRRLAPKPAGPDCQLDLPPSVRSSRAICSPRFQSTHQVISHDGSDYALMDLAFNSPLTPTEQVFHSPLQLPQMIRPERSRLAPDGWTWPKNSDISYSPLGPRANGCSGICLEHPLLTDHYSSCPETRVDSPGCYSSSSESEELRLARRISYSYAPSPSSMARTGSALALLPTLAMPEPSDYLASPLIIKPTPLYPVSYIHSENSTSEVPSVSSFEHLMAARNDISA
ncbi:TEA-domain-containing protein [Gyrodon lividus]|nr:TEA-domain-containing protein [Gyrodon lividus]